MIQLSRAEKKLRGFVARHSLGEIELGLDRIKQVYQNMSLPPPPFVYTIAGTNGKGSCAALLAAAHRQMGRKVGLYTSPHIFRFEERACMDGVAATEGEWCDALDRVERARQAVPLTYFEYCTLAAFALFADHELDLWILEVGLGGRLDAVNIIDSDCAIISSIAIDHSNRLGNKRSDILYEKMGIARSDRLLVYGDPNPPLNFASLVKDKKARLLRVNYDFGSRRRELKGMELVTDCEDFYANHDGEMLSVAAAPQQLAINMAIVWQAFVLFPRKGRSLSPAPAIRAAWQDFSLPGRWQKESLGEATLFLDVAHNPAAAQLLARRVGELEEERKPVEMVIGMMEDKDWRGFIQPLLPFVKKWHIFPLSPARAFTMDEMERNLRSLSKEGNIEEELERHISAEALVTSIEERETAKTYICCGSFYLVGELLSALKSRYASAQLKQALYH